MVQRLGISFFFFLRDQYFLFSNNVLNCSKVRVKIFIILFKKNKFKYEIIIRNVSWAPNHHIRMISEGSCDTEDWSNDC